MPSTAVVLSQNIDLSAQAMPQTLCNQEATGLDFTGVNADPNMIPLPAETAL